MKSIVSKILELMKKIGYFVLQYGSSNLYCVLRFIKVQIQKCRKFGVMKKLAKAHSGLGAEVYALYRQGAADWQSMPSIQQQLRAVEAAESDVFQVDGVIDEINNDYARKKDELNAKYTLKRSQVGREFGEES
jgi:hypothetical protein